MSEKHFSTLIEDIYLCLQNQRTEELTSEDRKELEYRLASVFAGGSGSSVSTEPAPEPTPKKGYVRASNFGTDCDRELWYKVNHPDLGEEYSGSTLLKFMYGNTLETLLTYLIVRSGHSLEGCQDEVELGGVVGHIDAIVDGLVVDIKSASSFSFKRFQAGLTSDGDSFGYLPQLGLYLAALRSDPRVKYKNLAAFLACDKQSGELCLDVHEFSDEELYKLEKEAERKVIVGASTEMPFRGHGTKTDKKLGREVLGLKCSYCAFKFACWKDLEVQVVSGKPKFVVKGAF